MNDFNPFSLVGKTVFVTGASSGIGRSIAIACSKMGAVVVAAGRNLERLNETLMNMEGEGHSIVNCDLTNYDAVKEKISDLPKLDGVVHCAGIGHRMPCKLLSEADVDSVMTINFKAQVLLQAELLQQKKINKNASIVLITSIAADSSSIGNAIYSASKGALLSYANCLAEELAPKLVRVNCISPAMVWTGLGFQGGVGREDLIEDEKRYPLKRYGMPDDIANLAIYLLSDASSWMTGSNIKITGGITKLG